MANKKEMQKGDGLIEKLVSIDRHSKVVKGGRIFGFSALTVVGNGKNRIGIGRGKAREVPSAIQKAMEAGRRNMVNIDLNDTTVWYPITFKFNATKVFMKQASKGTGIISGGAMRAVFEVLGIHNILSKIYGSTKPINVVKATVFALQTMQSPKIIAKQRGKRIEEIF